MKVIPLILLIFFSLHANGQLSDTTFRRPLDIPVLLSGTFAELRSNHLHSGIDFRTQGVTGHKIYACEQGYVSRIKIDANGYGNALYITHPNGYTTVYAHLECFCSEIAQYVKEQQYKRERFSIDLFPDSTQFRVIRGQVIALSGNSGGSSGPHLHFEVRETATEKILNPVLFNFGVRDNVAPVIRQLAVYPIGERSTINGKNAMIVLQLEKVGKNYRIVPNNTTLSVKGKIAFAIDTYDQTYSSANKCGPYNIRFQIDSIRYFSQTMDKFSFDESLYVNSLIDYGYYIQHRVRLNRLYLEPNNRLGIYDYYINRGIVSFPDPASHSVQIDVSDIQGNHSTLNFAFNYEPEDSAAIPVQFMPEVKLFKDYIPESYTKDFSFTRPGIKVQIPANALYDNINFEFNTSECPSGKYSKIYHIHNIYTPLHKAMTVEITADSLPVRLQDKALLVRRELNGKWVCEGGIYQDGVVKTTSRSFGDYAITVDTIAPRILPINLKKGATISGAKNIRFKITDEFSGINSYNGWIDGKWVLFEYDAKNDLIVYEFDANRINKGSKHSLILKVTDRKNNVSEYKADFIW